MRRHTGLTLVELLTCLAIVALLTAFAVPIHREAMQRVRRQDARSALLAIQGLQERFFFVHGRYAASLGELGDPAALAISEAGFYRMQLQASADDAGFVAVATPRPEGPQRSDACRRLLLDARGRRWADGDAARTRGCWG